MLRITHCLFFVFRKGILFLLICIYSCSLAVPDSLDRVRGENPSNDICDFYYLNISTNSLVVSKVYGVSRYIDCDNAHQLRITRIPTSNRHFGIVFYDKNKQAIESVPFFSNKFLDKTDIIVEIPSGASFFRTSYYNTSQQKKRGIPFEYELDNKPGLNYRKYQTGNIYFSVNVVQDLAYYSDGSESDNVQATTSVLALPPQYDPYGDPVPIIMYCHGYSHYVYYDKWGSTDSFNAQKKHWTDMGFAVFDTNGARNNNKRAAFYSAGCPQFVEAMRLTFEYIKANYNVSDEVYIVGGSAGGPLALNYARFNSDVKGVALLSPWTDLYDCIWQQGCRSIFVEFYGFPDENNYCDSIVEYYDPSKNLEEYSVPIKIWISTKEKGGTIYRRSHLFVDEMKGLGKEIEIEEIPGLQHSELVSGANEIVDFGVAEWFMSLE